MRTAIVGGGAAGFFLAINLKEMCPAMEVTILERGSRVLRKVAVSGGGRCNCTNTFEGVSADLRDVYPRGHRLMKRLFNQFSPQDAFRWFESRGVPLTVQPDGCVFPQSQDSHTIISLFLAEAHRLGVVIRTNTPVNSWGELSGYDFVAIATGGLTMRGPLSPSVKQSEPFGLSVRAVRTGSLSRSDSQSEPFGLFAGSVPTAFHGSPIIAPVPSLFSFSIGDGVQSLEASPTMLQSLEASPTMRLADLMGTVVEHAQAMIPGTKLRAKGPLLITHWGMSGPCILRLSSYAARELSEHGYRMPLSVNWVGDRSDEEVRQMLLETMRRHPQKMVSKLSARWEACPAIPLRLWAYLAEKHLGSRAHAPWGSLNQKEVNRLANGIVNDQYQIAGRAPFKDEFVTCGGIDLSSVNPATLESRLSPLPPEGGRQPRLFFAGEVLDIDGVTGGFNFQAAWTTAYVVATAIKNYYLQKK